MLSDYITDIQVQTFFLRMFHSFLILLVAVELLRVAGLIDNTRVMRVFWKGSMWMLIYFTARAIAGVLDTMWGFSIGWASNVVQIAFWGTLIYKVRDIRLILSSPKNDIARQQLRKSIDEVIAQLDNAKANARRQLEELHTS